MWGEFEAHKESLMAYCRQMPYRAESGLDRDALTEACNRIAQEDVPKCIRHARMMAYVMEHAQLAVNPNDWFVDGFQGGYIVSALRDNLWKKEAYAPVKAAYSEAEKNGEACRAFTSWDDFGHAAPYWERLLALGFPGILNEIRVHRTPGISRGQDDFYESCEIAYTALLRLLDRLAAEAELAGGMQMKQVADNLRNLARRAPQTMHEAMQLIFIFYFTVMRIEGTIVRSFGMLDRLLLPFYRADLQNGTHTEAQLRELLQYFLYRIYAANIGANLPFSLCGTDADGNDLTNELSYLILDVYGALNIPSPKLHLLCSADTPRTIKEQAMRIIQNGNTSIVFANNEVFAQALRNIGVEEADARRFVLVGCYEPSVIGKEIACTCNGRVSLPKAVEYAMTNGVDLLSGQQVGPQTGEASEFGTFADFYAAVLQQAQWFSDSVIRCVSAMEMQYPEVHHAPLFSATYEEAVTRGVDVYSGGAKYNNSSINMLSLATAADALYAIKQLVFTEKRLSLAELREILQKNWDGYEKLRLHCKNHYAKYGNNQDEVDALAVQLVKDTTAMINNRPNGRGGRFRAGYFTIDWRIEFGRYTGASADGRKAGEPLSKNIGAAAGMDIQGVTAHILSATKIDYTQIPNGTALDLVFHASAARVEAGLQALVAMLDVFLARGGEAFQCNIFDPSVLRQAQKEPEKYATLQVRLCGWNVYFVDLSKTEQDEFILQAETAEQP